MDVLYYSSAIVITIAGLFFGASFIRKIFPKNIKSKKTFNFINSYTLGAVGVFGWIIWSVVKTRRDLLYWQVGLALFTFGVCIFLYQRFSKKDAAVEELRMEKRQLHIRIKELSKSYDFLKKETTENLEMLVGVSNHRNTILSALKEANTQIIILSGWLTDWAFNEEFRTLILEALKRGVVIYIGYGYKGKKEKYTRKEQNLAEKELINLKAWCAKRKPDGRLITWKYPNHAKLLLVDNKYAICGSFNWLSNVNGHNEEMSIKIKQKQQIDEISQKIISSFESSPPNRRSFLKKAIPFSDH